MAFALLRSTLLCKPSYPLLGGVEPLCSHKHLQSENNLGFLTSLSYPFNLLALSEQEYLAFVTAIAFGQVLEIWRHLA